MNEQQKDPKTILLVEDEALIAVMEKEILKKHGFNVIIAHSGENAIEIAQTTQNIDLILMDINLGKGRMDGTEAAEIILREKEVPVLFLSSYTQAEVVEKTERITSYGYVVKDSGETVLLASIKMAFKLYEAHRKLKEREKALQEGEEKYRNIFNNSIEGIFQTTLDGRFISANPALAHMLGYGSPEELISTIVDMRSQFYTNPEDRDELLGLLRKQGFLKNFEVPCRHKNGSIIWGSLNIHLVRDDHGNISYIEGTCQDITERKQADEKLNQHTDAMEASMDGMAILNEDQQYVYVNKAHVRIYGYDTPGELIGKSWRVLYDEDELRRFDRNILPEFSQKGQWQGEARGKKRDGSAFTQEVSLTALGNNGLICVVRDITERKRTEEVLRDSEARYRNLFEGINDAVFVHELDKDGMPGPFIQVNDVACRRLGYTREELLSLTPRDITIPGEFEKIAGKRRSLASQGELLTETIHLAKDGRMIHVESNIRLFQYLGRQVAISISRDITDRKQAEDKIKNLLAEKELLLREVHHRIKNNMNVIMSLLSLQSSTLKDPSAISSLEDARSRVQTMMILYDKLYRSADFREISTKEYLTSLIDEIVMNFPNRVSITIETQIDDIILDAKTLSPVGIILNELLTNAMKHAFPEEMFNVREPAKITITLTDETLAPDVSPNPQDSEPRTLNVEHRTLAKQATLAKQITLMVQDNGAGIPESIDITTTTGFGLQLVGILTEQLEGTIRIERQEGTQFILEFEV